VHPPVAEPDIVPAKDPVCGMTVKTGSPHRAEYESRTYLFCSAGCRARFESDPGRYLGGSAPDLPTPGGPAPTPADLSKVRLWTRPMHPEIVRDAPGSCPICGMALERFRGHRPPGNPAPNPL
jgi:Cu+-exporting ATPase